MAVVLIGALDTKGRELGFVRDELHRAGLSTLVVDVGSLGPPTLEFDVSREEVFRRAGSSAERARSRADRGEAVAEAARGVADLVVELDGAGEVEGILAIGGSAGTVIGTAAMRALPFGRPKVMVSTLASGQVRPFVGGSDIFMLHSVADIAGLNRLTRVILANGAHALAGMVQWARRPEPRPDGERPVVAATMFGVTTACVDHARATLEARGFEVIVFHATGVGGQAMETLIRDGLIDGVLDLTTTELADELVGGILSAGPERLEAAVRAGVPLVVSLGALDMVNFGPRRTVPERFEGRLFHVHNEAVTLMRTTPEENAALGSRIADVLSRASRAVVLLIPLRGVSALDGPGRAFHDPAADDALFGALRRGLEGHPHVRLIERDEHLNDPAFAGAAAGFLEELTSASQMSRGAR
jgi:uncharacterized protein (UPF0261 family)